MSSDYAKELLRSGIIDAKTGSKDTARRYLDRAIYVAGFDDRTDQARHADAIGSHLHRDGRAVGPRPERGVAGAAGVGDFGWQTQSGRCDQPR